MKRRAEALFSQSFDLAIVGGGIYGATLAREATAAGYQVALVEQGDFGAGASANSMRVLHGGLRYLQHLDFPRVLESVYSRNYFLRFAPWLIDNVEFVIPLKGVGMKSPSAFRAALLLYSALTPHKNRGVNADKKIPHGRILDRSELLHSLAGMESSDFTGGGAWYESVLNQAERLILELIRSAADAGAVCMNHTQADELIHSGTRVSGLVCTDNISGKSRLVQARCVIDCSNRNIGQLGETLTGYEPRKQHWCRAVNLVVKRPLYNGNAAGLSYRDHVQDSKSRVSGGERMLFFVPWNGQTMVGTFYDHENTLNDGLTISALERQNFLDIANRVYTGDEIRMDEISRWHSGWMPLQDTTGNVDLAKDHHVRWVNLDNSFSNLIEVTGVKFTTAPAVVRQLVHKLEQKLPPSLERKQLSVAPRPVPLSDKNKIFEALEEEMVCHLSDLLLRRTHLSESGKPGEKIILECATLMAEKLGWNEDTRQQEIDYIHTLFKQQGM